MKKLFTLILLITLFASTAFASGVKFVDDSVLDAGLAEIATGTRFTYNSAVPANFAGIAAVTLANITVTAGAGNGDFTLANGDTSGRKITLAAQTGVTLTGNGTVITQCVDDGTTLLGCLPLAVDKTIVDYTTETWDSSAVDFEIADITQ